MFVSIFICNYSTIPIAILSMSHSIIPSYFPSEMFVANPNAIFDAMLDILWLHFLALILV